MPNKRGEGVGINGGVGDFLEKIINGVGGLLARDSYSGILVKHYSMEHLFLIFLENLENSRSLNFESIKENFLLEFLLFCFVGP